MYCFINEDMILSHSENPLFLQAQYAEYLGEFCLFSLAKKSFSVPVNAEEELILRGTCDNVLSAVNYLDGKIRLFESEDDIEKVENWYKYIKINREIFEISADCFLAHYFSKALQSFYDENSLFFVKSKTKNFSSVVSKSKMFSNEFSELIRETLKSSDIILISKCCRVRSDSLGKKEIRCFVRSGQIINCSRHIHSVKHSVPKSLRLFAEQKVKTIGEIDGFPTNYVIDIAEFENDGEKIIDVVEVNPFSTSQCYVNNSVFTQADNKIADINNTIHFGYEYCLDYLKNPEKYVMERFTQESYEYSSDSHFSFV